MNSHPLLVLGRLLLDRGHRFTTITPASHARVVARHPFDKEPARTVRDVLGWSRPFRRGTADVDVEALLHAAGALVPHGSDGALVKSTVRASTLSDRLYFHSAFPTDQADAVFFGPDTYRYVALLRRWLPNELGRVVDVGAGSGAGALSLRARDVVLADVNDAALALAAVNAQLAGVTATCTKSDVLASIEGDIGAGDAIISNPPYLVDDGARAYRHGGTRGVELPQRIVREGLARLRPGGTLVVYTGTPVVNGVDVFFDGLKDDLAGKDVTYEELDVDVFGEELERAAYEDVERIALVGLRVRG